MSPSLIARSALNGPISRSSVELQVLSLTFNRYVIPCSKPEKVAVIVSEFDEVILKSCLFTITV